MVSLFNSSEGLRHTPTAGEPEAGHRFNPNKRLIDPYAKSISAQTGIAKLLPRPLSTSNVTASVIFRVIEKHHPSLLIDEADSFMRENEELRGIVNSGDRRDSASVLRNVGDDHEPRSFSTWAPMVIAAIGTLPDTIEDRSIVVPMRRKQPGEKVQAFAGTVGQALRVSLSQLVGETKEGRGIAWG